MTVKPSLISECTSVGKKVDRNRIVLDELLDTAVLFREGFVEDPEL